MEELGIVSIRPLDSGMEITYIDPERNTKNVEMLQVMVVDQRVEGVEPLMLDILDAAKEIIDAGLLEVRNPPQTLSRRQRD